MTSLGTSYLEHILKDSVLVSIGEGTEEWEA